MNDDELITAVKESVTGVHMTIPAEQIVRRSRAIRARRRIPAIAGTLAVAAWAALAVTMLLPSSHQPGRPARVQVTAWTVAKQADGTISVTIRELRDPAGLQSTLRADGLPATVSFSVSGPPVNPSCQPYPDNKPLLRGVFPFHSRTGTVRLVIDPSALPSGAGVSIFDLPHPPPPPPGVKLHGVPVIGVGLVRASPQCTGS